MTEKEEDPETPLESVVDDVVEIGERVMKGENPLSATANTLLIEDGKPSLQKLKEHKWAALVAGLFFAFGIVAGNPGPSLTFAAGHWIALIGMIVSFGFGWVSFWLFKVPEA